MKVVIKQILKTSGLNFSTFNRNLIFVNSQGEYFNSGICRFKQTLTHSIEEALQDIRDFIIMHFSIHTIRCHQVIATPISLEINWTGFKVKEIRS